MCGNKITEKFIRLFRDFEKISVQGGSLYLKSQLVFDRIVLLFNSYWGFELKHKHILKYMSRYYTSDMDKISPVESDSEYDNSVWFFWDDLSKINPLVERCIRQAKKYSGRNVILVSNDNVDKFVDIPEHIWKKYKKGLISKAHYSDYVRTCIMEKYGGVYMDSTVLQVNQFPDKWFDTKFFTVNVDGLPYSNSCVSRGKRSVFFFACKKHNPLMIESKKVLCNYWKCESKPVDYLLMDYAWELCYLKNNEIKSMLDAVPKSSLNYYTLLYNPDLLQSRSTLESYKEFLKDLNVCFLKISATGLKKIKKEDNCLLDSIIKYEV